MDTQMRICMGLGLLCVGILDLMGVISTEGGMRAALFYGLVGCGGGAIVSEIISRIRNS